MKGQDIQATYEKYWVAWRESERKFYKLLIPTAEELLIKDIKSKLEKANYLKEQGNSLFRSQNYEGAIQVYISAIESAPKELFTKYFISEYRRLKLAIITNLANCFLKSRNFEAAVLQCEEGLKIFAENVKLRYIQGTALSEIQEYDKALTVLREAKNLEPSNREVIEKINIVIQAKKDYNIKMKEMFGGKLQPIVKKETIEKSEPVPVKNKNWGFYALGAVSLVGLAGFLYKKYR